MKYLWVFDPDAVWTLIPLCSLLWAWGGSGIKPFRKYGIPAAICLSALSFGVAWWLCLITAGMMFGLMTIPYGEDIKGQFGRFYYAWLFICGFLYAFALIPLVFAHGRYLIFLGCLGICSCIFGILSILSQRERIPWKIVEMVYGASLGLTAFCIIR